MLYDSYTQIIYLRHSSDVCIMFVLILLYVEQGMYYRVCNMHV